MKPIVCIFLYLVFAIITLPSCCEKNLKTELKCDIDSLSYAEGVLYASQVENIFTQLNLDNSNKSSFIRGFQEGFRIDPKDKKKNAFMVGKMIGHQMGTQFVPYFNEHLFGKESTQTISKSNFIAGYISTVKNDSSTIFTKDAAQTYTINRMEAIRKSFAEKTYASVRKKNEAFLKKNKLNKDVVVLPSGLQYKILIKGKGLKPTVNDIVKVHYKGTNIDGKIFDSSYERKEPVEFSLKSVISGWAEGIQLMTVGSKYVFYIPAKLAYGDRAQGSVIIPFSTLIFEVELLKIIKNNK